MEPFAEARARLQQQFGVAAEEHAGPALAAAGLVVWAVKPQTFKDAAAQARAHVQQALQLSVAAGIRSDSMKAWLGTERIVRSMPNTPALVGKGMTALYARPGRHGAGQGARGTGDRHHGRAPLGLAGTASGRRDGPVRLRPRLRLLLPRGHDPGRHRDGTGRRTGAAPGRGHLRRRLRTCAGLREPLATLRERVTSKGGTTHAALTSLEQDGVKASFVKALHAACKRAEELGDEFGR